MKRSKYENEKKVLFKGIRITKFQKKPRELYYCLDLLKKYDIPYRIQKVSGFYAVFTPEPTGLIKTKGGNDARD
jgi:hypothetical protein